MSHCNVEDRLIGAWLLNCFSAPNDPNGFPQKDLCAGYVVFCRGPIFICRGATRGVNVMNFILPSFEDGTNIATWHNRVPFHFHKTVFACTFCGFPLVFSLSVLFWQNTVDGRNPAPPRDPRNDDASATTSQP